MVVHAQILLRIAVNRKKASGQLTEMILVCLRWEQMPQAAVIVQEPHEARFKAMVICIGRPRWRPSLRVSHSMPPPVLPWVRAAGSSESCGSEFTLELLAGSGGIYF